MAQSSAELTTIHLRRLATNGKKYFGDNEKIYIGTDTGQLRLLDSASTSTSSTSTYQNAVGNILTDTSTIDFTYNSSTPSITADLKNTTVVSGVYGSTTLSPKITIDSTGRITSAIDQVIAIPPGAITLPNNQILVGDALNIATAVPMSGEASIINTGVVTLLNSAVIGKLITGYISNAGVLLATDTILEAFNKLNGNINAIVSGGESLAATLAIGNSTGANNILINNGQAIRQDVGNNLSYEAWSQSFTGSYIFSEVYNTANGFGAQFSIDQTSTAATVYMMAYDNTAFATTEFLITSDSADMYGDAVGFAGIKYSSDFSANYTIRSLIDSGYAAATFAPISVVGSVTSVAALTLGTIGTDLSSTVATNTTTPVITLNVPSSSSLNRGVLLASDWTIFNNKQDTLILTTTGSSGASTLISTTLNVPTYTLSGLDGQPLSLNLTSVSNLTYVSTSFVKMTAANTFSLDTSTYLTENQAITVTATGEATGVSNASSTTPSLPLVLLNSAVIGKVLTGFNVLGTSILATDTILEAFGKTQNQINDLLGGVMYVSTWAASTNTPALADGIGTKGYYYVSDSNGVVDFGAGNIDFNTGDWAIYNGTIWQKVDNTDAVSSVNGYIGAVSLTTADVSEVTNLYFTNARAIGSTLTAYSSGAGTVADTDTILQAIQKLNGNTAALVTGVSSVNSLTGAVALTGTSNRLTISVANVFDISSSYVGQSSITTLGTITTGVWNGTAITNANLANSAITINGTSVSLGGTRTLNLASADFVNQGTTTTVLHGNAAGDPSFAQVSLTAAVTGVLPIANGGTATSTEFTTGSVVFAGASGVYNQDNANLFWDDSNNRLGIGIATPLSQLDVSSTTAKIWIGSSSATEIDTNTTPRIMLGRSNAAGQGILNLVSNESGINSGTGLIQFCNYNIAGAEKRNSIISGVNDGAINSGKLQFYTSNAGSLGIKMTILNSGNVGIGTATPSSMLSNHSTAFSGGIATNGLGWTTTENDWTSVIWANPSSGAGYAIRAHTVGETSSDYPLALSSGAGAGTIKFRFLGNGNLGIGTTPSKRLDIKDAANNSNAQLKFSDLSSSLANGYLGNFGDNVYLGVGGSYTAGAFAYDNAARAMADVVLQSTSANAFIAFRTAAANAAAPTERMRIDKDGNVGIGVVPTELFHVVGTANQNILLGNTGITTGSISMGGAMTSGTISIAGGSAVMTGAITIGSTGATSSTTTIRGGTGTGAITFTPGTAGTIVMGATAGTGTITIGSSSATQILNLGTGTGASTVNIATGATTAKIINIATATLVNTITIGDNQTTATTIPVGTAKIAGAGVTVNGAFNYGLTTGLVNVMALTLSPIITGPITGQMVVFKVNLTNTTTTPSLNVNSSGAKTCVKRGAAALAAGDLLINDIYIAIYNGTEWNICNPIVR